MPKKPIDYSKTIIYKLVCKDLDVKDLYVGHTTNWKQRKRKHKSNCNNTLFEGYNSKIYKMIREYKGWNNWEMIEIEKYPCNDEREARARERFQYEQLYASMNTVRPLRTEDEKKEYTKEYNKKYREENKEVLSQKKKEYHQKNKEVLSQKQKEYREKNIERIKEYDRNRSNKEERNKKNNIQRGKKYTCSCGSEIRKDSKARHERTPKHQQYIELLN